MIGTASANSGSAVSRNAEKCYEERQANEAEAGH